VPSAIGSMPAATRPPSPTTSRPACAPGDRVARARRLHVANSVVAVLPRMTPPARRTHADAAAIRGRPMVLVDGRAVFGRKIGGVENILDADGEAAQRRFRQHGARAFGQAARAVDVERRERADLALACCNRRGAQIDCGSGGQLARLDAGREIERETSRGPVDEGRRPQRQRARERDRHETPSRRHRPPTMKATAAGT